MGYPLVFISTATGDGIRQLLLLIDQTLSTLPPITVYEPDAVPMEETVEEDPQDTVIRRDADGAYVCEGKWLERLCGRVYFDDRESLMYFQRSLNRTSERSGLRRGGYGAYLRY